MAAAVTGEAPALVGEPQPLAEAVLAALAGIAAPHVYDLGAPIDEAMPQWPGQQGRLSRAWVTEPSADLGGGVTFAVERIAAALHTSTHLDAVVHVQAAGLIHGGEAVATAAGDGLFARGGVEAVAPVVAPFVLLDVAQLDPLPDDAVVEPDDLERAAGAIEIEPGTAILVRTGKMHSFRSGDAHLAAQPGLGLAAARWLCERRPVLVGSDTAGTEPLPMSEPGPVHRLLLFEHGLPLVENLVLDQLAAAGRRRGVLVCLPLKLVGATASWVRPVAIA
jgi:kynurenine formamidase